MRSDGRRGARTGDVGPMRPRMLARVRGEASACRAARARPGPQPYQTGFAEFHATRARARGGIRAAYSVTIKH